MTRKERQELIESTPQWILDQCKDKRPIYKVLEASIKTLNQNFYNIFFIFQLLDAKITYRESPSIEGGKQEKHYYIESSNFSNIEIEDDKLGEDLFFIYIQALKKGTDLWERYNKANN